MYTWKKLFTPVFLIFTFSILVHSWFSLTRLYFSQDLARDLYLMEQFKTQGKWLVSYGPKASVGNFYLPPLYYQLFVLLYNLFPSPLVMTLVITLVESLTPVLVYILAKEFLNKQSAIIAGLLAAMAPLAIIFGTFSWNPNMVPFFSLLSLIMLLRYNRAKKQKYLVAACSSFVVAFQLHYQATVLLPAFLFVLLQQIVQKRFRFRHWFLAIFVASLLFTPYFLAEFSHNFPNTKAIYAYITKEHARYFDQLSKSYFVWTFIPAFMERIQLKANTDSFRLGRVLIFFGLPLLSWYAYKKKQSLIPIYFLGILFMLRVYKGDKVDYYMSTLFILPSLVLASFFYWKKLIAIPLIIFVVWVGGKNLLKIKPVNQLSEFNQVIKLLQTEIPDRQMRFIIHDDDATNLVAFLVQKGNIAINQQSLMIVDICKKEQPCYLYPTLFSSRTGMEAFTSQLRETGKYHYKTTITPRSLPFILHVGYLEQKPQMTIQHPLLQRNSKQQFGSDVLLQELFQ